MTTHRACCCAGGPEPECFKLPNLCPEEDPWEDPLPCIPCDQVTEDVVFAYEGRCWEVGPDSPEVTVCEGTVLNLADLTQFETCIECQESCWRQAEPCNCPGETYPAPPWVPCSVIPPGGVIFKYEGVCWVVTPQSPTVNEPPTPITVPQVLFECCEGCDLPCCGCDTCAEFCGNPDLYLQCDDTIEVLVNPGPDNNPDCMEVGGCICNICGPFTVPLTRIGPCTWRYMPNTIEAASGQEDNAGQCPCIADFSCQITGCEDEWVADVTILPYGYDCPEAPGCAPGSGDCFSGYDFVVMTSGGPPSCACPSGIANIVVNAGGCLTGNPSVTIL